MCDILPCMASFSFFPQRLCEVTPEICNVTTVNILLSVSNKMLYHRTRFFSAILSVSVLHGSLLRSLLEHGVFLNIG